MMVAAGSRSPQWPLQSACSHAQPKLNCGNDARAVLIATAAAAQDAGCATGPVQSSPPQPHTYRSLQAIVQRSVRLQSRVFSPLTFSVAHASAPFAGNISRLRVGIGFWLVEAHKIPNPHAIVPNMSPATSVNSNTFVSFGKLMLRNVARCVPVEAKGGIPAISGRKSSLEVAFVTPGLPPTRAR